MKRRLLIFAITFLGLIMLTSCGSSPEFKVDTAPKYKVDVTYPIILSATENGDAVTGLDIVATLEMAKMDHGVIKVEFDDNGDGTYTGEVELPMGGEWIANVEAEQDGKTYDDMLTFDVKEE